MLVRQPRYSKEEFARRGDEIYQSQIRSQVEEGNSGKIVAITSGRLCQRQAYANANDIETGAFELAENIVAASEQLLTRYPDAQIWFIRIGHQAVYHFGASRTIEAVIF